MAEESRFVAFIKGADEEYPETETLYSSSIETDCLETFTGYIKSNYSPRAWERFEIWDTGLDKVVASGLIDS